MDTPANDNSTYKIPLLSLTTDFGLTDEYVGVMKGVILRGAPQLRIVDLCHHIEPQNVLQAALLLSENFHYFPDNTLHVVVVDPGVGTQRKIILAKACNHLFLAPDNGVLSFILARDDNATIRQVVNRSLFLSPLSNTFHGRDIFAPVAGALGSGLTAAKIGPEIAVDEIRRISWPAPNLAPDGVTLAGTIIGSDHFGNLLTNIHQRDIQGLQAGATALSVHIGGCRIDGLASSYGQQPAGAMVALIGSRGYLEIALSGGNARQHLAAANGQSVAVSKNG